MTEGDGQYEYGYLEGDWEKGKHRKWCAMLTKAQFTEFVRATGLVAESTETLGSIGAPGFGFGWSPAISFRDEACEAGDPLGLRDADPRSPQGTRQRERLAADSTCDVERVRQ